MEKLIAKITFEDVKKEISKRQEAYYETNKNLDRYIDRRFAGIRYNEMIYIKNHWPKSEECNQYLELNIEFEDTAEIPLTLLYIITNTLEE